MSDLWVKRLGNALVPDGNESVSAFAKLPLGKPLHVDVKQPRNGAHHRLFWVLVHRVAEGIGAAPDTVADLLKIASGHCTAVKTKSYGVVKLPKSISFSNMDQTAFSEFFERCVQVIYEEWGIEPASVADLLVPQEAHVAHTNAQAAA